MKLSCGWLSPSGTFVECKYFEHDAVANELVEKYGYKHGTIRNSGDMLIHFGWVRISISLLMHKEWHIEWERALTEYQKNFIKDYFENEFPVSFGTRCKWEREEYL